jgi:hypothetical protein
VAITAMCAPGAVSLASGSASSVRVKVPATVRRAQTFTITASGSAPRRSHLVLFLAQQQCSSSYAIEYNDVGAHRPGFPYFQRGPRIASRSNVSNTYTIRSRFSVSAIAHTGKRTGPEYVCAYIPSRRPTVTRAHGSATYHVIP